MRNCLGAFLLVLCCGAVATAQRPRLVVQQGHSDGVHSVAFSPDGRMLASASIDGSIKLWDVAGGTELTTLRGHTNGVYGVAFSPDGRTLASVSIDGTVKLWQTETGEQLASLPREFVGEVTFSPDGRLFAVAGESAKLEVWDLATRQKLWTLVGHEGTVGGIAFSPDGRTLASGGNDGRVKLWDIKTGTELRTLSSPTQQDLIESVAFAPDGQTLISGGREVVHKAGGETKVLGSILVWDVTTGALRRKLGGHASMVNSVALSADGKYIASGGTDKMVKLWDAASGALVRTYAGHRKDVNAVAFSPDGTTLASCSGSVNEKATDHEIKLWPVATGAAARTLSGHTHAVTALALSRDGKLLATGAMNDATIKLWNNDASHLLTLKGHRTYDSDDTLEGVCALALSPDGKMLASGSFDETAKLWDTETGRELHTLTPRGGYVRAVAFSPDGKFIVTGSEGVSGESSHLRFWDAATGAELSPARLHINEPTGVFSLDISADGKRLVAGGGDWVKTWDLTTGALLKTFAGGTRGSVWSVAFSPDARLVAGGSLDKKVRLWNAATGTLVRTLDAQNFVRGVSFSADGSRLAQVGDEGDVALWDVATGRKLKSFAGHSADVYGVRFMGGDRLLLTAARDTLIKLWDTASGEEMANVVSVDEDDWLVALSDGAFDGSPAAWNRVQWRFSDKLTDVVPVEIFFNEFYDPGLLSELFVRQHLPSARLAQDIAQKDRRQPVVRLTAASARAGVARSAAVQITVVAANADAQHSSDSGAQDVRLFRNGSLIHVWHGDVLHGQAEATLTTSIPVVAGKNQLTAYAFNRDNVKSADATLVLNGAEALRRQGTAYVLAVGVNSYANHDFDLKYAVADARDFGDEWQRQQTKLGTYAETKVVALTDAQATKANVLAALADLAAKVQPEDSVVIYFAGHGTAQQNRFYLVPHDLGYEGGRDAIDEAGLKTILAHSISDAELQDALEGVDAGQLLMVIDACNSGQALESDERRRGPMNSKGLAQLAYEKGMYILTAAQSYQAAQEASKFGHGFLTFALVEEGVKQSRADYEPKDGQVMAREWFDYATERVPQMQLELMVDAQAKRGVKVAFVNGDEQIADPAKRNLQHPRVFYRREGEASPVVVARP